MRIFQIIGSLSLVALPLWMVSAGAEGPRVQRLEQLEADLADIATDGDTLSQNDVLTITGAGTASPSARFHGNQDKIHEFVGADGIATLTNAPESFNARDGYQPVELRFEPVTVSATLDKGKQGAYSTELISRLVETYCRRYGMDPNLVYGVIQAESGFDAGAVSPKGARGLMQLMPATAAEMGIHDLFDPAENIAGGVQYLARMMELFNGDLDRVLASYNAGPEAVRRYNGIPPYEETRQYVSRVQDFRLAFAAGTLVPRYKGNSGTHAASFLPSSSRSGYVVHFNSGYTQPAEKVEERGDLYILHYHGRVDAIRKGLVAKVVRS